MTENLPYARPWGWPFVDIAICSSSTSLSNMNYYPHFLEQGRHRGIERLDPHCSMVRLGRVRIYARASSVPSPAPDDPASRPRGSRGAGKTTQDVGKSSSGNLYASSSVLTNPYQTESNNEK